MDYKYKYKYKYIKYKQKYLRYKNQIGGNGIQIDAVKEKCENDMDIAVQAKWEEMDEAEIEDVVLIRYDGRGATCHLRSSIVNFLTGASEFVEWIKNPLARQFDDEGHGGIPKRDSPKYVPFPIDITVYVEREPTLNMLHDKHRTYNLRTVNQLRLGNLEGYITVSGLHGQIPPKPICVLEKVELDVLPPTSIKTFVYTCGNGRYGQLGHGDKNSLHTLTKIYGLVNPTQVACGNNHTAIIIKEQLYTFGNGEFGKLGHNNTDNLDIPKPLGLNKVIYVACGKYHTATIVDDGRLYTFGRNDFGQLGHGDRIAKLVPTVIENLINVSNVACGEEHTVVVSDGRAYTFGKGTLGRLGHGGDDLYVTPKALELENVTNIACGAAHTAIISNRKVYTFGNGFSGQLGHGEANKWAHVPTIISTLSNVTKVSCGVAFTAVISGGYLHTFGSNEYGQLGYRPHGRGDRPSYPEFEPNRVENLVNVSYVSCGNNFTAVIADDRLYTFGDGEDGQLGHGSDESTYIPTPVRTSNILQVASGGNHIAIIAQ